ENLLNFEAVSNSSYRQALAPRTYLSARYQPLSFVTLGGLLYNEFTTFGVFTGLSLNTRFQLGRVLAVGGGYTIQSGTYNNLGLNTALKLGPLQIYAVADNIAPLVNPERVDGTNFRLGLNLTFGRKKMEEAIANNLDSLQQAQLYADLTSDTDDNLEIIPEDKPQKVNSNRSKRRASKRKRDMVAGTPRAETAKPSPKSQEEEMEMVSSTAEELASDYVLQTSFKDLLTKESIDLAHVVIFRYNAAGNKIFVRTERYSNDQLDIVMEPSADQHELTATTLGYEPLKFTFVPIPGNKVDDVYFFRKEGYEAIEEDVVIETLEEEPAAETVSSPTPSIHSDSGTETSPVEIAPPANATNSTLYAGNETDISPIKKDAPANTTPIALTDNEIKNPPIETIAPSNAVAISPAVEDRPTENTTPTYSSYTLPQSTFTPPENEFYYVTQSTSLRSHATSQSDVLRRLAVDTRLELLEKTYDHWWYVSYNGKEGWVKAHLLQR
ncbi:MAG: DUF5723 family protein, partial [Bacteroidota bacterium]